MEEVALRRWLSWVGGIVMTLRCNSWGSSKALAASGRSGSGCFFGSVLFRGPVG